MRRIEHLTKRYRIVTAIDRLSFESGPARSPASSDPTAPTRPPRCGSYSAWPPRQRDRDHRRRPHQRCTIRTDRGSGLRGGCLGRLRVR